MKIVYMGTPDFAAGPLRALLTHGFEVVLCVTQPDKPKGRSDKPVKSPVKLVAEEYHVPVFQPDRIRDPKAVEELAKYPADVFVVAAFGQILPDSVLSMPPLGCVNLHASLLPRYRGSSPIQQVILDGEKETGITLMRMDSGVDTGDILLQKKIPVSEEETGGSLFDALAALAEDVILEGLPLLGEGRLKPVPQDNSLSSHAGKITKEMGRIDFKNDASVIERQIRALDPWPSAYTLFKGKTLKIWKSGIVTDRELPAESEKAMPGTVIFLDKESFTLRCGKGALRILEVQAEGKKRMKVRDFLLGNAVNKGDVLPS